VFVWEFDPAILHIGSFEIRWYGLLYAFVFMGGFYLWRWQMLRGGHTEQQAERFLWLGVIGVLLGARLGHVFFYEPERYLKDPIQILYFWKGGLASHGSTITLVLVLIYFAWREKMRVLEVIDRFAMSAALGSTLIRIGNFTNSEIVGRIADSPKWAVKFPIHEYGVKYLKWSEAEQQAALANVPWRYPSQLVEVALGLFVLGTLWLFDRKFGEKRPLGLLTFLFFLLYFTGRFFVEYIKEYQSEFESGGLTMGQYLSLPFMATGLIGLIWILTHRRPTDTISPAKA
jgi:prolipoprotein diacylglyceryl transferase